jgi:hypothetical protein
VSKCEHGIYVPQGIFDGKPPSCSGCHPDNAHIIFVGHRAPLGAILSERVLDSAEYMSQPPGERLTDYAVITESI